MARHAGFLCTLTIAFGLSLAACGGAAATEPPVVGSAPRPTAATAASSGPLRVKLLAFNDFHGNLKPPNARVPGVSGPAGGAAYFAAHMKRLGAGTPNTLVVAAGDLVGGSPLTSALFHDEPTVEVMNAIGLDVLGVGNHEFDEGLAELLRLKKGGCHPKDGCLLFPQYGGARFDLLGANVVDRSTGARVLPPYVVRKVEGVPIGIIGMTLEGTPSVVVPSGIEGLAFRDEAKTANELAAELRGSGVETIVLLVHEGGLVKGGSLDDCNELRGSIPRIVNKLDPSIDVVVSGHTHALYNCRIGGRPVTSALSFGRVITEIELTIDRTTRDVIRADAHNHAVTHDVTPDARIQAIVDQASTRAAPLEERVIGRIARTLRSEAEGGGESKLGSVVADAQLEATRRAGATIAVANLGGLRASLVFPKSGNEPEDGLVTYGEAFTTQPFGNVLVTLTLTGAELVQLFDSELKSGAVLQVSEGTVLRWSRSSRRVVSLEIGGKAVDPSARVKLTTNNFLADTVPVLKKAQERVGGPVDIDALEAYFKAHALVDEPKSPRIVAEN